MKSKIKLKRDVHPFVKGQVVELMEADVSCDGVWAEGEVLVPWDDYAEVSPVTVADVVMFSAEMLAKHGYHGLVHCTCGHIERVDPSQAMREGWPEHCDETMVLQREQNHEAQK